ncbi:nuclear transport factor 2 family protein [Polymorphobacter sp.]|uniref:nuclear transport factor 2 family protein n=1 Tax=Polymorphobacter sp. TaxID=1909290 RepID=UPI003F70B90C
MKMLTALVASMLLCSLPAAARTATASSVARVLDRQEIERLHYMLGYYMDNADWRAAASLFDKDATFEVDGEGRYLGQARIAARLRLNGEAPHYGHLFQSLMMQPVIAIAKDGRSAKARFRALDMRGVYQREAQIGEGVYENRFVKRDGVWKVSALRFYRTFLADYAGGWTRGARPLPGPRPELPADEPPTRLHPVYPEPFTPPLHGDEAP